MFRKFLLTALVGIISLSAHSQSIDEKIGKAMNESDWFTLDSLYNVTPKDSISPFLEVFSRCLLGNRLNRPDVSIPAFQELLNTQSENIGLPNLISTAYMFGMDLSRVGYNAEAASIINAIISSTEQYLDSTSIAGLRATTNRYEALASYKPYQIDFPSDSLAIIPFSIIPVGPADKGAVLMHLNDSYINGIEADITFDTGAGANMISHEMAEKFNLIPLESTIITVSGVAERDGYIAIAKELKLGNIIVKDVPFTVISLSSNNEEADKYIDCFNIVVGSELMLQLKDLTIDFINRKVEVPTTSHARTNCPPNLCFSPTMNLLTNGTVLDTPMTMCLDSGDASFGSLDKVFFEANKEYITTHASVDSIREAGIGGVIVTECYKVPNMPVSIGNYIVSPSELIVKLADNSMIGGYGCNIGVKTMMLYGKLHFNLVDFVLIAEPPTNFTSMAMPKYNVPTFKLQKDKGLNPLQAIGMIGVGIARSLINPNAPNNPDL